MWLLVASLLARGCVYLEGMPSMPPGSAADPRVYASGKKQFSDFVNEARVAARTSNATWVMRGTAGEVFARGRELRERFGGVIFVGDSQIREIAWAALQMLTPGQKKRFSAKDPVFRHGRPLGGKAACVPQTVGKTGFTASCGRLSSTTGGDDAEPCDLHSPFHNKSHAEAMRKLLLTQPHKWDGKLSVSEAVCTSDFFVSYQATWGAMPAEPTTLPSCLHPKDGGDGSYVLRHQRLGAKPVLWVIDGCGLHEMEFCDARRWSLPQHVLPRFPPSLLTSGTVVWQTVGAGFLMKASKRFKGECADINADMVRATPAAPVPAAPTAPAHAAPAQAVPVLAAPAHAAHAHVVHARAGRTPIHGPTARARTGW